jgi:hypothetical protein
MIEYSMGPHRLGIAVSTDFESVPSVNVWVADADAIT